MSENAFDLLSDSIIEKLKNQNISAPTNVQNKIIPMIFEHKNVLFQSETGTGKTFAYLLPLVERLERDTDKTSVKIIITAPTFELASQINLAAKSITERKTALFIGGAPLKRQIDVLKEKPQIVIGTPARLVELINLKKLKVSNANAIIFDETDRMVKKELIESTSALRDCMPENIQVIACSATINSQVSKFFTETESVVMPEEDVLKKRITHWAIYAEYRDKIDTLRKFIAAENPGKALVFTSRSDQVDNIFQKLRFKKIDCMALHAKADKQTRKAAIDKFRSGKCRILITSDLSARGLDIANVTHVIQMDLPHDDDFFVHRSGRTARAGKTGINVLIGDEYEMHKFATLEKKLGICVYPKEIINGKIVAPE
ncbi:MAG: DEAD/DEAH box helicase [Treponema sp.]|nr:DEAD/DEAH box helicase [Treponema sp.]